MPQKIKYLLYLIFGMQLSVSAQICKSFHYIGNDGNVYKGSVELGLVAYHDGEPRFHSWKYLLKPKKRITLDFRDCSSAELRVRFKSLQLEHQLPDADVALHTDPDLILITGNTLSPPEVVLVDHSGEKGYEFIFKINPLATGYEGKLKGAIEFRLSVLLNGSALRILEEPGVVIKYTLIPPRERVPATDPNLATEGPCKKRSSEKGVEGKEISENSIASERDTVKKAPHSLPPVLVPDPINSRDRFEETAGTEEAREKKAKPSVASVSAPAKEKTPGSLNTETSPLYPNSGLNPDHTEKAIENSRNNSPPVLALPDSLVQAKQEINNIRAKSRKAHSGTLVLITLALSGILALVYKEISRK